MSTSLPVAIAASAAASAAAGWIAVRSGDLRRVEADPAHAFLSAPPAGTPQVVTAFDGTHLHAEVHGPAGAPTIVLAHGWTCNRTFWAFQVRELARDFRVVTYDQRGHGRSSKASSGDYSMEAFAEDFQTILDELVPPGQRAVAAGHSLGAMAMVAWAQRHPERVEQHLSGAALCNTGMGGLVAETLVVRLPTRLGRVKQVIGRGVLSARLPMPKVPTPVVFRVLRYVAMSKHASPARVAFCEDMFFNCAGSTRGDVGQTLSAMEIHDGLANLTVPTLVFAGADDRLTPLAHAQRMTAELPNVVEYVEVARCGHMGPVECPDEYTPRLRELALAERVSAAA
jgi:pimeloyl-ACP methyl ester carboxylesterase